MKWPWWRKSSIPILKLTRPGQKFKVIVMDGKPTPMYLREMTYSNTGYGRQLTATFTTDINEGRI